MRKVVSKRLTAILFVACVISVVADAQGTRRVADQPTCKDCRIEVIQGPMLRAPAVADGSLPGRVRIDSLGRFWVFRVGTIPALFDRQGRFLQLLGASGKGPGEYSDATDVVVIGKDSLAVIDDDSRRITILTADLKPKRFVSLPLTIRDHVLVEWPSAIIVHGSIPSPQRVGFPLHTVSFATQTGTVLRSFGPGDGEERPDLTGSLLRIQADGQAASFWVAPRSSYDLIEVRGDGKILRALERRPDWFAEPSPYNYRWKSEPPPPHVAAVTEDKNGLLWVFVRVAAPTWREAWPEVPASVREVRVNLIDYRKLYWTRVEVLDPGTAQLVAETTLHSYLVGAIRDGLVALWDEDQDGSVIRIVSAEVTRKQ